MMMSPGGEYPLHEKFTLSRFSEIVNELKISAARRIMGKIDVKNMELYYSSFHALICDALYHGLQETIALYKACLNS